ncbi:MAG: ABC transporter substrate-binding protein [Phycisphaerales bacterium]|nr:ABC transporter substrate-binding protein [Phycisphaerales bacterium]
MRIVSLIPSGTEIVALLGAGDALVGRSHECDFPPAITDRPALTSQTTHYDPAAGTDAKAIDTQVAQASASGQPLYTLNEALLEELQPDLIITQDLCSVCSIDLDSVRRVADRLPTKPRLLSLNPKSVEDILDDIYRVGDAIGMNKQAMHEVVRLRQRMDRAEEHINPYDDGPICGFMEWTDPIYIAGHWNVQLIERAGARHPLNEAVAKPGSGAAVGPQQAERLAGHSIAVPPEIFAATQPRYLVIAPCGLSLDQAHTETDALYARHEWFRTLPAVRDQRVFVVDGNQMFNRPGPRIVDALEFMVAILNDRAHLIPEGFPYRSWSPNGHND